jgi:ABC-type nitrate/sulfonate/bicarbonate transport system ATPase subunit
MSISKDLSVAVFGRAGTGKSTVAIIIADALKAAGINVTVRDEDTHPEALVNNQESRLTVLKDRLNGDTVEIMQVQLPRRT